MDGDGFSTDSGRARGRDPAARQAAAARKAQILELRLRRVTFEQIGKMIGISKQAAHKTYMQALNQLPNKLARMVRKEELEALDRLEAEFWRIISSPAAKEDPDLVLRAGGRILDTQARRAKLCGLEAPNQIALTLEADDWKEKQAQEQEELRKLLGTLTPDERKLYLDLIERAYERRGAQSGGKLELSDQTQRTMSSS
jgi:DNA-directed RNA polymerase specialized sigma24 family protein